jgi:hypothetical protein
MAGATKATFESALKLWYVGPIVEQLYQEVMVLELMELGRAAWNGQEVVIPFHHGRNTGVGASDAGDLPTAGYQKLSDLRLVARNVYGRFQVTGLAMASAVKGKGAFASWGEIEMNRLKDDVRNFCDRRAVSGGRVAGFLNEKQKPGGGASAFTDWEFSGDISKLQAALDAKGGNVLVALVRMARNNGEEEMDPDGYKTLNDDVELKSVNVVNRTVELSDEDGVAGDTDTTDVAAGVGIALVITDDDPALDYLDGEPTGIYHNLGSQMHFGKGRVAGSSGHVAQLQSNIYTQATATTDARADLSLERIEYVLARIEQLSGDFPDTLMMSTLQRQRYTALLQAFIQSDASKATSGDAGFKRGQLAYGDVKIKTYRQVDNGLIIFHTRKHWKLYQLEKFHFADKDGAILSRVQDKDAWEGFTVWRYDHICTRPNAQGMLVGLTLQ